MGVILDLHKQPLTVCNKATLNRLKNTGRQDLAK